MLIERCIKCHGPERQKQGLRLDTRAAILTGGESGPAMVPGKSAESLILEVLDSKTMPPKSEPRLTAEQITAVRRWIDSGAPMPEGPAKGPTTSEGKATSLWSFQKPDQQNALKALPEQTRSRIVSPGRLGQPVKPISPEALHPIDAFIETALIEKKLIAAPLADRQTLIRRAYFDLLGLPPTPEQVGKFVKDTSPTAWESMITELLNSPHYGERWGRHWLDVARYADSGGYETDIYYRHAWRYRDYVVKSFNDDKPYDRFVQEQIAGDEFWPSDIDLNGSFAISDEKQKALEAHIGTGFYTLGPQIHESNMDGKRINYERLSDWVDATGAAFMGMTIGCARCHDHKFDPFTQRDYFSLQAIFARSKEAERPIVSGMEIADFKQVYPRIIAVAAARDAYRQFEKSLSGRKPTPEEDKKRQDLLLAVGRTVLDVPERGGSSPSTPFEGLLEVPSVSVLEHERPELVKPVSILHRGDLGREREQVVPALPSGLAEVMHVPSRISDGLTSRKEFAQWLTRPDHPLTSRVIVNRVWQWHFGRGIVSTPSDFGKMGQPPSHPELLDWLATEFVSRGWSIKQLHYLIMTSTAYQRQSNFAPPENVAADPLNRMLWRFNRRRLEGEAVWDSMHAVAGTINLQIGGPPVIPPLNDEELSSLRDRYRWVVSPDPQQHSRRGVYIVSYRNFRFPLFDVFDAPNNAVSTADRDVSTVASQSLWLLNNRTAWRQAQSLAARILREKKGDPKDFVIRLWQLTLGRPPSDQEQAEALQLLRNLETGGNGKSLDNPARELASLPAPQGVAFTALALAMFNHNGFLFID
ncbi:MAG: PSD1 and planctomycete cytochrome C domain-containing protein [Planctomycetales bacterium]